MAAVDSSSPRSLATEFASIGKKVTRPEITSIIDGNNETPAGGDRKAEA
jgi:hypothetical protein